MVSSLVPRECEAIYSVNFSAEAKKSNDPATGIFWKGRYVLSASDATIDLENGFSYRGSIVEGYMHEEGV